MHRTPRLTAVILAAGAGTRLGALGRRYSKPTLPVAGRPLIDWVIDNLRAANAGHIVVVGHPSDTRLMAVLRNHRPPIALVAQRQRRGMADALRCALPCVAEQSAYLACACDSLFAPADIARLVARGREDRDTAVVGVLDMGAAATASRSAVRLAGDRVVEIIEKPPPGSVRSGLVAVPLYWLPRAMASYIEAVPPWRGERYVSLALNAFAQAGGHVRAVWINERIEITTPDDVDRAAAWLRARTGRRSG